MNDIDLELYKTFCKNFDRQAWWDEYIIRHPPQLHDVFQFAKDNWWKLELIISDWSKDYIIFAEKWNSSISYPYDPFESLLNQSEKTKKILPHLFK